MTQAEELKQKADRLRFAVRVITCDNWAHPDEDIRIEVEKLVKHFERCRISNLNSIAEDGVQARTEWLREYIHEHDFQEPEADWAEELKKDEMTEEQFLDDFYLAHGFTGKPRDWAIKPQDVVPYKIKVLRDYLAPHGMMVDAQGEEQELKYLEYLLLIRHGFEA